MCQRISAFWIFILAEQFHVPTSDRFLISSIHVSEGGVISRRLGSLDQTALAIFTFHRVTVSLDHESHVTVFIMAAVTYAFVHVGRSAVGAEFPRVYSSY